MVEIDEHGPVVARCHTPGCVVLQLPKQHQVVLVPAVVRFQIQVVFALFGIALFIFDRQVDAACSFTPLAQFPGFQFEPFDLLMYFAF